MSAAGVANVNNNIYLFNQHLGRPGLCWGWGRGCQREADAGDPVHGSGLQEGGGGDLEGGESEREGTWIRNVGEGRRGRGQLEQRHGHGTLQERVQLGSWGVVPGVCSSCSRWGGPVGVAGVSLKDVWGALFCQFPKLCALK